MLGSRGGLPRSAWVCITLWLPRVLSLFGSHSRSLRGISHFECLSQNKLSHSGEAQEKRKTVQKLKLRLWWQFLFCGKFSLLIQMFWKTSIRILIQSYSMQIIIYHRNSFVMKYTSRYSFICDDYVLQKAFMVWNSHISNLLLEGNESNIWRRKCGCLHAEAEGIRVSTVNHEYTYKILKSRTPT